MDAPSLLMISLSAPTQDWHRPLVRVKTHGSALHLVPRIVISVNSIDLQGSEAVVQTSPLSSSILGSIVGILLV